EHDAAIDRAAVPSAVASAAVPLAMILAVTGSLLAAGTAWLDNGASAGQVGVLLLLPLSSFEAATALPAAASQYARSQAAAARLPAGWPAAAPRIRDLDLDLRPGSRLAVTGASGTGKSTLLSTLAGLLDPLAGRVELDGHDLASLPGRQVRQGVVMFAEDAHVFATTVRENLRVVRADVDDASASAALRAVGLDDWVATLPRGLDTMLGPDGTTVSGGERRRLLLARSVLRRGPVLLLDEPTEHLDTARGDALLEALLTPGDESLVPASTTVVVVTHRLEAIPEHTAVLRIGDGGHTVLEEDR